MHFSFALILIIYEEAEYILKEACDIRNREKGAEN